MARGVGLFLVALLSGLLVFWLAAPHFAPFSSAPQENSAAPASPAAPSEGRTASQPLPAPPPSITTETPPAQPATQTIPIPHTSEQQEHEAREAKRAPFYSQLKQDAGDLLTDVKPADEDSAALIVYLSSDDGDQALTLLQNIVTPNARQYGFNRVRCYLPNPPGVADRYRFHAEATLGQDGVWHIFLK